jgi:hypothetical protein
MTTHEAILRELDRIITLTNRINATLDRMIEGEENE